MSSAPSLREASYLTDFCPAATNTEIHLISLREEQLFRDFDKQPFVSAFLGYEGVGDPELAGQTQKMVSSGKSFLLC